MDQLLALTIGGSPIQAPPAIPTGGLQPGGTGEKLLQNGLTYMLIAALILAMVFLIFSGIKWITSGGDKTKVQSARGTLTYSLIGLIIAFAAFAIVSLISGTLFNFNILDLNSNRRQPTCGLQSLPACTSSTGQPYCTEGFLDQGRCW